MARQVIEKRTADNRIFTVDCRGVLGVGETITNVASLAVDAGGVTFGAAIVNAAPVLLTDDNGVAYDTVPIGQAFQAKFIGGTIPAGFKLLLCVARAQLQTSVNINVEATFGIRLLDNPIF